MPTYEIIQFVELSHICMCNELLITPKSLLVPSLIHLFLVSHSHSWTNTYLLSITADSCSTPDFKFLLRFLPLAAGYIIYSRCCINSEGCCICLVPVVLCLASGGFLPCVFLLVHTWILFRSMEFSSCKALSSLWIFLLSSSLPLLDLSKFKLCLRYSMETAWLCLGFLSFCSGLETLSGQ